jgi:signal transduction histidine kinase
MTRRLLLSFVSITAFVLLVLEVPLGFSFASAERRRLETSVQHDALAAAIRAEEFLEGGPVGKTVPALQQLADQYQSDAGGRLLVVDSRGIVVADSEPLVTGSPGATPPNYGRRPEIAKALGGREVKGTRYSHTLGTDLLYVAVPVASGGHAHGAVRITYPLSFVQSRVRRNWLLLAAIGGVVLVVVFFVSMGLARSLVRPLASLERGAIQLGEGSMGTRVPVPSGPHELRTLARSFNTTASQLEQLVGAQGAFVADASHQLRTPLAALRLRLENLEPDVAASGHDDLEGALEEVQRLSVLVDGLLVLTRAEHHGTHPEAVDVARVVTARRDAWLPLAEERGVRIDVGTDSAVALVTPGRLEQVLDNLLNNALGVAPQGSAVRITAMTIGEQVELRVADAGPGMSPEQRERAFDRFWRAHTPTEERGEGFGLGLSIVRQLVTADGGDVELGTGPEGGLQVTIRVPAATGAAARPPS